MRGLVQATGEDVAQLARAVGKTVQHLEKQRPRNKQHAGWLERCGRCRARALGEQRDLAQQCAGPDHDGVGSSGTRWPEPEAAFLNDETSIGLVACTEQDLATMNVARLRADGQDPQRLSA